MPGCQDGTVLSLDRAAAGILDAERASRRQHGAFFAEHIPGMLLRVGWPRGAWVRGIFDISEAARSASSVLTQLDLARVLNTYMEGNKPIVHIGVNLDVKRAYCGMAHERRPRGRWAARWRVPATWRHSAHIASEAELKCEYMARHGGAAGWAFLPHVPCGQVDDRRRLGAELGAEDYWPAPEFTEQDATPEFCV